MQSLCAMDQASRSSQDLATSASQPRNPGFPATHGHGRARRSAGRPGGSGLAAASHLWGRALLVGSLLLAAACSGSGSGGSPDPIGPPPPSPPSIASPSANQVFQRGEVITFALADSPDPSQTVRWESSLDLALGEGSPLELQNLSPGPHTVSVKVDGAARGTVDITVENRTSWNLSLLGNAPGSGGALWSDGNLVALACQRARPCEPGVTFYDVSNPAAPTIVAAYRPDDLNVWGIWLSDGIAYFASKASGSTGFVNEVGVRILDVTDPVQPVVLADITSINEVYHVFVADGFLYASNDESPNGTLHVFDVRDPRVPIAVAEIRSPLGGRAWHARVLDGRLYAIFGPPENLVVFDVSEPSAPVFLGATRVSLANDVWPSDDGRYAFVTADTSVLIYDVTAGTPQRVAAYRSLKQSQPHELLREGSRLFVSLGNSLPFGTGIEVLDISTPTRPRLTAFYDLEGPFGPPGAIYVEGGSIFVAGDELSILGFR